MKQYEMFELTFTGEPKVFMPATESIKSASCRNSAEVIHGK